jgi:peptidoglycan hydrolase-like protein with peptidoglycan-binding domain
MRQKSTAAFLAGVAAIGLSLCGVGTADAMPGVPVIKYGDSGTKVKCVQEGVNDWAKRKGHGKPLSVDGKFGSDTLTWVKKFQRASNLSDDGLVGQHTGDSILDNLQGDSTWRVDCYPLIPSVHR